MNVNDNAVCLVTRGVFAFFAEQARSYRDRQPFGSRRQVMLLT